MSDGAEHGVGARRGRVRAAEMLAGRLGGCGVDRFVRNPATSDSGARTDAVVAGARTRAARVEMREHPAGTRDGDRQFNALRIDTVVLGSRISLDGTVVLDRGLPVG
jgi:hypothetical protein